MVPAEDRPLENFEGVSKSAQSAYLQVLYPAKEAPKVPIPCKECPTKYLKINNFRTNFESKHTKIPKPWQQTE